MKRVLDTARVQLAAWPSTLGLPWLIVGISFVINLAIFLTLNAPADEGPHGTGGLASLYVFVLIAYVMTMTHYFPMALGMSVTRRVFYLATCLVAITQAVVYSVVILLLGLVENATGGWWTSLQFFDLDFLHQDNVVLQLLIFAVPMLVAASLGMFFGVTFKRWGATGMYTLTVGGLVVFGGLAVLVTWSRGWAAIGAWFADQSWLSLLAGWPALLALVLAAASFLMLRRATP